MKRTATLLLIILMVSFQTPLGQFLKLPLLIEHYIKHQEQAGISIITFFASHYASDHKDADFPEDEQLPFKNITFNNIGYAIVTPVIQANAIAPLPAEKKLVLFYTYSPQQHLASIFHPPRA